jgi:hypothetical protein
MEISWGDGLGEETQGLDILGIRVLDQSLETALSNGITTISLRGRYFTILPWLIGEFFEAEKNAGATSFAELTAGTTSATRRHNQTRGKGLNCAVRLSRAFDCLAGSGLS